MFTPQKLFQVPKEVQDSNNEKLSETNAELAKLQAALESLRIM